MARPWCAGGDRDTTSLASPSFRAQPTLGKSVAACVRGVKSANHPARALRWSRESRGRGKCRLQPSVPSRAFLNDGTGGGHLRLDSDLSQGRADTGQV